MPITLKTFSNPIDAHFLKSKLENEGIWCELLHANTNTLYPMSNLSISGIKLVIHKEDTDKAISVLEQNAHHIADNKGMSKLCPHCNSGRIKSHREYIQEKGLLSILKSLFSELFNTGSKQKNICKDCNRRF